MEGRPAKALWHGGSAVSPAVLLPPETRWTPTCPGELAGSRHLRHFTAGSHWHAGFITSFSRSFSCCCCPLTCGAWSGAGNYRRNFGQRLGFYSAEVRARLAAGPPRIWLQAVSVGEMLIALKLVDALRERCPDLPLVLSTTTTTGYHLARERAGAGYRGGLHAHRPGGSGAPGVRSAAAGSDRHRRWRVVAEPALGGATPGHQHGAGQRPAVATFGAAVPAVPVSRGADVPPAGPRVRLRTRRRVALAGTRRAGRAVAAHRQHQIRRCSARRKPCR